MDTTADSASSKINTPTVDPEASTASDPEFKTPDPKFKTPDQPTAGEDQVTVDKATAEPSSPDGAPLLKNNSLGSACRELLFSDS